MNPAIPSNIDWEEEMKKCSASPYYFYTNYVIVQTPEGPQKATTNLTEENFNKLVQKYDNSRRITKG